ncbi:hypothetical protein DAPPUDRAFT_324074 [Daphnia pulex]|uniref:Uncharacterized protein n=1 Tax=Daphnia pulex TaxID=6669 RepID=E9H0M0_DAPPU|nr:hypothetical protein DAPPUDRAFT_324074 [Daphnia pulex]|eukprot:EFX74671.1 hypothetical protein DAPPUDRAFT_324074 [Daphnia pulex]
MEKPSYQISKGKVEVPKGEIYLCFPFEMESYGEFKSDKGVKFCGNESPSTTSEDTLNLEWPSLSGWSKCFIPSVELGHSQIDKDKFVEQMKLALSSIADKDDKATADFLTVMINIDPALSPLYVKIDNCFLNLNIPHACFIDSDCALTLNTDSGLAYKYRVWTPRAFGHLEQAVQDLRLACQIHYDK